MDDKAHYESCTWDEESHCADCELKETLGCRLDKKEFRFFMINQIPSLFLALFGLVLVGLAAGAWWPLIVTVAICVILWGLGLETRVLCSHCPYWTEASRTLHCWALTGSYKFWRYRPEPIGKGEKGILMSVFSFLLVFPICVEAYGIWFMSVSYQQFGLYALLGMIAVTVATILAVMQFSAVLRHDFCSRCVNLSCAMNTVPKAIADKYLEKNPVMKEAWDKSDYRLGQTGE
jgi:hypothetical protein